MNNNTNFTYTYRQVPEIIQQKTARVGGLPFLTVWQFMAMFGVGGVFLALEAPLVIVGTVATAAFVALYVHNGEFLALRWWALLKTAVLIRMNNPPVVNLTDAWKTIEVAKKSSAAAIYRPTSGAGVVTSSVGEE